MKTIAVLRDQRVFVRDMFTVLVLAVLFLVTGCASSDNYTPRAELAPPPPFMTAETFGPAVPVEIAMLQNINIIEPAAGGLETETYGPAVTALQDRCAMHRSFAGDDNNNSFGFGLAGRSAHESEYSFSHVDSAEMGFHFTVPFSAPKSRGCR